MSTKVTITGTGSMTRNADGSISLASASLKLTPATVTPPPPPPPPPVGVNKARPFAPTSLWNTPIPATTKWFDTPALHTIISSGQRRDWWVGTDAANILWSDPSQPLWTFDLPGFDSGIWNRKQAAAKFTMHAPATITPGGGGDNIVIVADPVTGQYVEIWLATVDSVNHVVSTSKVGNSWAVGNLTSGTGFGDLASRTNAGVRASNFSWIAGLITGTDIAAGKIDHALALGVPPEVCKGDNAVNTPGPYIPPATCGNGDWPSGPIYMGTRLGIPAGVAMPANLSSIGQMVFHALQTYGAFVGDVVGSPDIIMYADGASTPNSAGSIDFTPFMPLVGGWGTHPDGTKGCDMDLIGPLVRVCDYQP